jgi:hypothetical protein
LEAFLTSFAKEIKSNTTYTNKHRDPYKWIKYGSIASIIYAGFTLVIIFIGGYQGYLTRQAVTVAADTERRQLRAYVIADKASVALTGRSLVGTVELRNSGQTPAYDMMTKSQMHTEAASVVFSPPPFESVELDRAILGPQSIVSASTKPLSISPENTVAIPAFQNGTGIIYLWGETEYRDVFDRKWVLSFRFRSHHFDGNNWVMEPAPDGNEEREKK